MGGSILTALAPLLPFIAAGAVIATLIAGIVIAVNQANEAYHKFDTAVNKANDTLNKANEQLKKAQTHLNDVKSALDDLDNNPFEGLTKGTLE